MTAVFISYSREDKPFVQRLHDALRASDYDVWVDWEDIPPSAEWFNEIRAGVGSADGFIYPVARGAMSSENNEFVTAAGGGVALYDCDVCGSLSQLLAIAKSHTTQPLTPSSARHT